jgi:hypothetical protein
LQETVESLKAAPWPTPEQIAPYVGEWNGFNWINPDGKNNGGLRIRVVGGKVTAQSFFSPEPGVEMTQPIEYLKVTKDGLEFGHMNGMRPMGMIVSTGKRTGNVLQGTSGFRGIRLPLPGGRTPPTIYFEMTKQ